VLLISVQNSFTGTLRGEVALKLSSKSHLTLNASLHYLVKYKLSKIAPIVSNTGTAN